MQQITICLPFWAMDFAPVFVAVDNGFFLEEELDAKIVYRHDIDIRHGYDACTSELIKGGIQFIIGTIRGVRPASMGEDVKIVCGMYRELTHRLMAKPEIRSITELKGRRIMHKARGGTSDMEARFLLRRHGIDPDRDVTWIESGPGLEETQHDSLKNGAVDATTTTNPYWYLLQRAGFRVLGSAAEYISDYPNITLVTTGRMVRERPEVVKKAVRAIIKSVQFLKASKKESVTIIRRHIRYADEDAIGAVYDVLRDGWDYRLSVNGIQKIIDLYCSENSLKKFEASRIVYLGFLESAARELDLPV